MKAWAGRIGAELLIMRHTFLYPLHLGLPVLGAAVFLVYGRLAEKSVPGLLAGYIEFIGVMLPFVISVVCAGSVHLEEGNHFQVFLGTDPYKWRRLLTKVVTLAVLGFLSIALAVFLFGTGFAGDLKEADSILYVELTVTLFLGSLPLYLEHMFLNLQFSGMVSQCVGVAQFLLSALFLTGLGDGWWRFFPCSWSARGAMLVLSGIEQTAGMGFLSMVFICAIIGLWFHNYEGRHCND